MIILKTYFSKIKMLNIPDFPKWGQFFGVTNTVDRP